MSFPKALVLTAALLASIGCGKSTKDWKAQAKSHDSAHRLRAVHALQERVKEADTVVPTLAEALADEDMFVRRDAARALAKFGPSAKPAVPALRERLRDQEPSVRKAAAKALEQIDPAAVAAR
jgi:HEAT repeat protein